MTKGAFVVEFDRLCRGFRHESTSEQAEAWFRRIGHYVIEDWEDAVTTLLCAPRFPFLDPVLQALDEAQMNRRRLQVERDKTGARSAYQQLREHGQALGCPFSPELFEAIKTISARQQVRVSLSRRSDEAVRREEDRLTSRLAEILPKLPEEELSEFMDRYSQEVAR